MNNKSNNIGATTNRAATMNQHNIKRAALPRAILGALAVIACAPATAIEFGSGDFTGTWDTTISYGASWRVEERDPNNVGKANNNPAVGFLPLEQQIAAPGRFSVNGDNGNLNYDDGDLISHAIKVTTELGFSYKDNFGGFFRASGFYDFENADADFLRVPDERFDDPVELVGEDIRLLDAYLYWDFEAGENLGTVRLGRQVVSWGESTFIQGGINVINPVDVSKLRVAGAELKEAFLPVDMIYGSIDLSESLSFEATYLAEFEQVEPDPFNSYFSTNDFGTPGGRIAMLGFGLFPEEVVGLQVPRTDDRDPSDSGQFGLALRYFASALNDTEFGFYYLKYHSRLPLISGRATVSALDPLGSEQVGGEYFVEYPEDLEMWGVSFNTEVGGIALQGEYSFRDKQPIQIDEVEVLFAALTPLNPLIPEPVNQFQSQLGTFAPGQEIQGWNAHEVSQLQFTATKLIGPGNWFKADQMVLLAEVGVTHVWDLPDPDVLRYEAPGTTTGGCINGIGSELTGGNFRNPVCNESQYVTDTSWGYRFITRLDFNSAFGTPINLFPRLAFNHDVDGVSPGPGGNFIEDRKSLTLGVGGSYLEKWGFDVSYTAFFDAEDQNLLHDRDFVSFNVRRSF